MYIYIYIFIYKYVYFFFNPRTSSEKSCWFQIKQGLSLILTEFEYIFLTGCESYMCYIVTASAFD